MKTKVYKLYGTSAADANALAQVIIQRSGYIHAVSGNLSLNSTTTGHFAKVELSKASVGQLTTNDTVDSLFEMDTLVTNAANGTVNNSRQHAVSGLGISVAAGDRLYINLTTPATAYVTFHVYVAE